MHFIPETWKTTWLLDLGFPAWIEPAILCEQVEELLLSGGQDGCIQCHGVSSRDVLGSGSFMGTCGTQ